MEVWVRIFDKFVIKVVTIVKSFQAAKNFFKFYQNIPCFTRLFPTFREIFHNFV